MKRYGIYLIAGLLLVPGCKRNGKVATADSTTKSTTTYKKATSSSVYDEDVDAFVLEDKNPFAAPQAEGDVLLVEETETVWNPDERQGQFETIYFEFDKHSLRKDQEAALKRNVAQIKGTASPASTVVIEGHACNFGGSASHNMALSEKRAREVQKSLVKQGVPAQQLKVVGRGSEMCKVLGGSKDQQAPNRRVELYLLETAK